MKLTIPVLLACLLCSAVPALAADDARLPSAPMTEEVLHIAGDPARPATLEVTLFTPAGPGPFPLAVVNHGATHASNTDRGERYRFTVQAYYFLSRGYAVALPMMRGFAGSDDALVHLGCDLAGVADRNARDIRAVIDAVSRRPGIDPTRIVVAGQSFGAWNTLGVGALAPANVRGLIVFNAAVRSSDCNSQDAAMADGAARLAERTKLPSIWFYGDNDSIMPVATWRSVFDRYSRAGGRADLVAFGRYGADSHQMLSDPASLPFWAAKVDAFLARIGMPSRAIYPDFLPHAFPPPSHVAALSDEAAVPFVNGRGRALYQRYLSLTRPKVFIIGTNGAVSMTSGGYDPLGFSMAQCRKTGATCAPYAANDDVVWTGPKAGTPAAMQVRRVARTVPANGPTLLGTFVDLNQDCSSRGLPSMAVVQAPVHGRITTGPVSAHPNYGPASDRTACNAQSVPALGVTYTPTPGFSGPDALTIEETTATGLHLTLNIELTVL